MRARQGWGSSVTHSRSSSVTSRQPSGRTPRAVGHVAVPEWMVGSRLEELPKGTRPVTVRSRGCRLPIPGRNVGREEADRSYGPEQPRRQIERRQIWLTCNYIIKKIVKEIFFQYNMIIIFDKGIGLFEKNIKYVLKFSKLKRHKFGFPVSGG